MKPTLRQCLARRNRSVALALALALFVFLLYFASMAKMDQISETGRMTTHERKR